MHLASIIGQRPQITSRQRSPEHNRRVGGSATSYHLSGRARDFLPPRGFPRGRRGEQMLRQEYARRGIQLREAIDEGDHFHIAW